MSRGGTRREGKGKKERRVRGIDGCYQVCVREKVRKAKRSIISRAPSPAVSLVPATRGVHGPCPEIRDRRRGGGREEEEGEEEGGQGTTDLASLR